MNLPNQLHAFKLDQRGVARVFGELEAGVMEVVWSLGEVRVADVCERLGDGANYKTVMTVMNRLVEKHALVRTREQRAFVYSPVETRSAFMQRVSRQVVQSLVQDFGDLALAQFVDAVDAVDRFDPVLLERLEKLVRERSVPEDVGA